MNQEEQKEFWKCDKHNFVGTAGTHCAECDKFGGHCYSCRLTVSMQEWELNKLLIKAENKGYMRGARDGQRGMKERIKSMNWQRRLLKRF